MYHVYMVEMKIKATWLDLIKQDHLRPETSCTVLPPFPSSPTLQAYSLLYWSVASRATVLVDWCWNLNLELLFFPPADSVLLFSSLWEDSSSSHHGAECQFQIFRRHSKCEVQEGRVVDCKLIIDSDFSVVHHNCCMAFILVEFEF